MDNVSALRIRQMLSAANSQRSAADKALLRVATALLNDAFKRAPTEATPEGPSHSGSNCVDPLASTEREPTQDGMQGRTLSSSSAPAEKPSPHEPTGDKEVGGSKGVNENGEALNSIEKSILAEELNYIESLERDYELITGNELDITITSNADGPLSFSFILNIKFENDTILTSIPFGSNQADLVVKDLLEDIEIIIVNHLQTKSPREDLKFTYLTDTNEVEVTNSGVTKTMTVHEAFNVYLHEFSEPTAEQHLGYQALQFEDIEKSFNELYSDGELTEMEIQEHPILLDLIENGLGWSDVSTFLLKFNDPVANNISENSQIFLDSIEALIDPSKSFTINAADFSGTAIPDDVSNVVIKTDFGIVSFNGPKAREYVEAWLTAYENSPTFREMMNDLIAKSDNSKYSINMLSVSGEGGANYTGHRSGFYINSNVSHDLGGAIQLIAHEAAHDFNGDQAVDGLDAGNSHSTEQATLIGAIFNELVAAGTDLGSYVYDADLHDYSSDVRLLSNKDFDKTLITSSMINKHPEIDIFTLRDDYALFQSEIEDGDYAGALSILGKYDGLTISLTTQNPAYPDVFFENAYDIQTLFMKDLLVNGDGLDWFGEEPSISKVNIIEFFNFAKIQAPYLEPKFKAAFDSLRLEIERDYPGLEFTPV